MGDAVDVLSGRDPGLYLIGLDPAAAERYGEPEAVAIVLGEDGSRQSLGIIAVEQPRNTAATVIGPVVTPGSPLLEEASEQLAPVDPWVIVEQRLHSRVTAASRALVEDGGLGAQGVPILAREIKDLVEAVQRIAAVRQAEEALKPTGLSGLTGEQIQEKALQVWRAVDEAGHGVTAADCAAHAVRQAFGWSPDA